MGRAAEDWVRWTVHFEGRVQGVGFRYTTARCAKHYDVRGNVRNLPDGRVKLVVEGKRMELESLLEDIRESMPGHIHHEQHEQTMATGEFNHFAIMR